MKVGIVPFITPVYICSEILCIASNDEAPLPNVVDTPADVKKVVAASVNFLNTYILGDEYKPWNMFFSGSFKGFGVGFCVWLRSIE